MIGAVELTSCVGVKSACIAMGVNRATFYRYNSGSSLSKVAQIARPKPPLSLMDDERQVLLDILHSERFIDQSP